MPDGNAAELARDICVRLDAAGYRALLVGGCVRDLLMRHVPKDFDVATSAPPADVLRLFPGSDAVGAHFGVVLVHEGDASVEVATFRTDDGYDDGRRPTGVTLVRDPRQDALRRDFTINAMFLDPRTGDVLDFVEGQKDLSAKIIRTVGDPFARFAEDHLRMLRAIRFAARFGFTIDPRTLDAITRERASIQRISAERVRDEMIRILTEGGARRGFELLDQTGLLTEILPEVAAMKGVKQPPEFHPEGDVWVHTLLMLEGLRDPTPELAMGVLLHDVGKPSTFRVADRIRFDGHVEAGIGLARRILDRLKFSRAASEQVEALVAHHMRFKDAPRMRESTLKRFLRMDRFQEHLELHRLDCASSHGSLENYEFAVRKLEDIPPIQLRPPRLITGDDLIREGYSPGPDFRRILDMVEEAQLEGRIGTAAEALALAREQFNAIASGLPSGDPAAGPGSNPSQ